MSSPILSITSFPLIERPDVDRLVIEIDGQPYEMAAASDLDWISRTTYNVARRRLIRLESSEAILDEPETVAKLRIALDQVVRIALPAIADGVLAKLNDDQKLQIMRAFSQQGTEGESPPEEASPTPSRSTSKRRSPASKGSTAGAPANG